MGTLHHPEKLAGVNARLCAFAQEVADHFGWDVSVCFGVRTEQDQTALYAKGRTAPGPNAGKPGHPPLGSTVTNAEHAWQTAHGRGAALDLAPMVDGELPWDEHHPKHAEFLARFKLMGAFAKERGFIWGGDWTHLQDMPHVELPNWRALPFRR